MASRELETSERSAPGAADEMTAEAFGHPRGTLAILALYGALFAAGWVALYLYFLGRGAPHP
jgi:hypothetical protein